MRLVCLFLNHLIHSKNVFRYNQYLFQLLLFKYKLRKIFVIELIILISWYGFYIYFSQLYLRFSGLI